ncbi:Transcription factor lbx1 [Branchiostoma belcheri]|nr:Transcription factor lbx1 [Branchiostoma belcheri]
MSFAQPTSLFEPPSVCAFHAGPSPSPRLFFQPYAPDVFTTVPPRAQADRLANVCIRYLFSRLPPSFRWTKLGQIRPLAKSESRIQSARQKTRHGSSRLNHHQVACSLSQPTDNLREKFTIANIPLYDLGTTGQSSARLRHGNMTSAVRRDLFRPIEQLSMAHPQPPAASPSKPLTSFRIDDILGSKPLPRKKEVSCEPKPATSVTVNGAKKKHVGSASPSDSSSLPVSMNSPLSALEELTNKTFQGLESSVLRAAEGKHTAGTRANKPVGMREQRAKPHSPHGQRA